jgi:antitoxin HicB
MTHYIALIRKDRDSCHGVSFPDGPGVIAAAGTLDEALAEAADALAFAAEGWADDTGTPFPLPRNLDVLRADPQFQESAADAVGAAVPFRASARGGGVRSAAVWLNPVPEEQSDYTYSIRMIRQMMSGRMYPLTLAGLDKAMRELVR